jgi:lipooligosaccharide transport system permease protein
MSPLRLLRRPAATRRSVTVARRNADVFFQSWATDFLPPMLEPALYLVILGFGLGLFIQEVEGLPYAVWFGPALLATTGMFASFFECAFGSFVRMHYQKTYDAITATPVGLDDVVVGELLWGGAKAALNSLFVLLVLTFFRVPQSPLVLLVPLVVFVAAFSFASIGLLTTSLAPNFDAFNFPLYLYITPMFFLSGTFIPLSVLDPFPVLRFIAETLPLTHAVALCRSLSLGVFGAEQVLRFLWLALVGLALSVYSVNAMRRRLIP